MEEVKEVAEITVKGGVKAERCVSVEKCGKYINPSKLPFPKPSKV